MKFIERLIPGVFEIQCNPLKDERGYFMRTYDRELFEAHGLETDWVQESHSHSARKDVIRGLHFQLPPFSEAKYIRVVHGEVLDVFVDIRPDSPTFGKWDSLILTKENGKAIYLPKGIAHGFCTLTETSDMLYKMNSPYNKEYESGIIWNDRDFAISWPVQQPIISDRDSKFMDFQTYRMTYKNINFKEC